MIGIKKQTQWYLDRANELEIAKRKLDPTYDLICTIKERYLQAFEDVLFFGYSLIEIPIKPKYFEGIYK